jgi:pfkB family carbohydrate kinase
MKSNQDPAQKKELIEKLIVRLDRAEHVLHAKKATTGFDGFVDTIVRIIKNKKEGTSPSLFRTKKQFGKYITEKEDTSFSLELEERSARIGGNMPILSNALGSLGIQVNCIGAMGHPKIHPIFRKLSSRCHVYSFAEPGHSTAFEFEDGKIMLAQMGELNHLGWKDVVDALGLDRIVSLFQESGLICMVNWSEISMSTDVWKGILREVVPRYFNQGIKQTIFFDLSDCSKRSSESILEVLKLIKEFVRHNKVILGLNKNESNRIYEVLFDKEPKKGLQQNGEKLFEKLGVTTLVLHSSKEAVAFQGGERYEISSFHIKQPTILTGAGDNFNGGFCAGQLLELDPALSLILAHAVSGLFIQTGKSPQLYEVVRYLRENQIEQ